jgi:hypothetical protein
MDDEIMEKRDKIMECCTQSITTPLLTKGKLTIAAIPEAV